LCRNIRNIHKKLVSEHRTICAVAETNSKIYQAASSKADAVIVDNPDQTLDELVASKKINADQKAQVLKKPALQAQLKQYEDQVTQFRKVEKDLEDRFAVEKAHLIEQHQAELARTREEVIA
jgi:Flp pilus assembly CpaE family ATPase